MNIFLIPFIIPLYGQYTDDASGCGNTLSISYTIPDSLFNADHLTIPEHTYKTILSLKSNLLYTCAGILNIETEVPIHRRWSLNTEMLFPWWVNKRRNSFAFQLLSAGVEGRYWFSNHKSKPVMSGHFIGLYANIGLYDFQFSSKKGYQGEFYIPVGISYGYALPVLKEKFALEFSFGIGYMHTNYRHYRVVQNHSILAKEYNGKHQWLGPTKAKVSLAWFLHRKTKRKR